MDLIEDFKDYIIKKNIISKNKDKKILVGVSGGPDSLCLLDLLIRLKKNFKYEIVVFHLNHLMRENAHKDAKFVENFCQQRNLNFIIKKYDVPELMKNKNLSPEEAARKIRLELMEKAAHLHNIEKIALGHNKDDQVETIFMNIFRGTGLTGLTGISPVSDYKNLKLIHPLLNFYRQQIETYCDLRNLSPKIDPTNKKNIYTRNKIRNQLIPYIEKEINSSVKEKVFKMSDIIREENSYLNKISENKLQKIIDKKRKNIISLNLSRLKKLDKVIRRRVLKKAIYFLKDEPGDIYSYHYQAIDDLLFKNGSGKKLDMPGEIKIKKSYNKLLVKKGEFEDISPEIDQKINVPGTVNLSIGVIKTKFLSKNEVDKNNLLNNDKVCYCDADKITLPLYIRKRGKGDRFRPLGMKGTKKLKNFFIDEKIPKSKRDKIPVIIDSEDRIVWIAGLRMDDRFKINNNTSKIIKIEFKSKL